MSVRDSAPSFAHAGGGAANTSAAAAAADFLGDLGEPACSGSLGGGGVGVGLPTLGGEGSQLTRGDASELTGSLRVVDGSTSASSYASEGTLRSRRARDTQEEKEKRWGRKKSEKNLMAVAGIGCEGDCEGDCEGPSFEGDCTLPRVRRLAVCAQFEQS